LVPTPIVLRHITDKVKDGYSNVYFSLLKTPKAESLKEKI